jgi:hypothetical protein
MRFYYFLILYAAEALVDAGLVRDIGVSNFSAVKLAALMDGVGGGECRGGGEVREGGIGGEGGEGVLVGPGHCEENSNTSTRSTVPKEKCPVDLSTAWTCYRTFALLKPLLCL